MIKDNEPLEHLIVKKKNIRDILQKSRHQIIKKSISVNNLGQMKKTDTSYHTNRMYKTLKEMDKLFKIM